jgi:hypothetical protein
MIFNSENTGIQSIYFRDADTTATGFRGAVQYDHTTDTLSLHASGVGRVLLSSNGSLLATNSPGLGYGTGSGGTVTQATSMTNAVTLNKSCGRIQLFSAAVPIGGTRSFILNNSALGVNDTVIMNTVDLGGGDAGDGWSIRSRVAAGAMVIYLTNISGSAVASYFGLNFAVIKGSIT